MNRKQILTIAIILALTVVLGGYLWNGQEIKISRQNEVSKKTDDTLPKEKKDDVCGPFLPEFGDASSEDSDSILYTTRCIIEDSLMAHGGEYVSRAYIRGADNGFNKKIFETKEKILYARIAGDDDVIKIETSDGYGHNMKNFFYDRQGEGVPNFTENRENSRDYISPDEKFTASLPPAKEKEYRPEAIVRVSDISKGETKEYDFRKEANKLEGISIDSWSPDSRYLYVAGSIYEFWAPAKLWRIDVLEGRIKTYDLDGLSFPVRVFPEYGVAFVGDRRSGDETYGGDFVASGSVDDAKNVEESFRTLSLFKVDLETGEVSILAKETSLASFGNLFFDGEHVYYEASYGLAAIDDFSYRNKSAIKKIDVKTKKNELYLDDESHIQLFIPRKKAFILEEDKKMYYVSLETGKRDYIGEVSTASQGVDKTGVEYIKYVHGLVR